MQYSTAELIRLIENGSTSPPEPNDIYIVNDPYLGGASNGRAFCASILSRG